MLTLEEFAEHLRLAAFKARNYIDVPTEVVMKAAAEDAKSLIGQELSEWPALAESTVAEKERLGYTGAVSATDPLLRTGELRDSIKADAELSPGGAIGMVGSNDPIAEYQELGTSRIPPRPFMSLALRRAEPLASKTFGEFAVEILTRG